MEYFLKMSCCCSSLFIKKQSAMGRVVNKPGSVFVAKPESFILNRNYFLFLAPDPITKRVAIFAIIFGLALDGACRAKHVAMFAVGSYFKEKISPTISTLPVLSPSAVYFLWRFPEDYSYRELPGILLCKARTFLCHIFRYASDSVSNSAQEIAQYIVRINL